MKCNTIHFIIISKDIERLIWPDQNIGDSGATIIIEALNIYSTLTRLDMSCYEMKEPETKD